MANYLFNRGVKMGTSGAHHPEPPYTLYPWVNLCSYFLFLEQSQVSISRVIGLFSPASAHETKKKWRRRQSEADWFTFRVNPFLIFLHVRSTISHLQQLKPGRVPSRGRGQMLLSASYYYSLLSNQQGSGFKGGSTWAGSPFGGKTKNCEGRGGGKKPGPRLLYTGGTYSKMLRLGRA